jgi:serine/threonine protein kinase
MINRTIRNFEIKELIATGGMAAIYKAVQVSLDRIVAVKILHGHLAQDKDFITRFEREAKAAANLKHENVVNIIEYGKADDMYFIAMEYVDGKSLKDLINSVKFIPQDIALRIAYDISQGLAHAHEKGVVHRDIKPANIIIGYDGVVKIADFGLAQAQDLTSVTVTGAIVGTPAYMSPEQAGGKKVDHRSDIFSLGVVLYEMITGIKPFRGENYSSIIHEILTVVPPKPVEANPLLTREISAIIENMLVKDPDQRQQNIADIGSSINAIMRASRTEVTRKDIGSFIKQPVEQFQVLLKKRKEKHFERGFYFMTLGDERLDDALGEFEKILHLDAQDVQALKYVAELKDKKKSKDVKAAAVRTKSKVILKPEAPRGARIKQWPALIIGGGAMAAVVLFVLFSLKPGRTPVIPVPLYGYARVSSMPDSAEIFIDGKSSDAVTPSLLDSVSKGQHTLEVKKAGYRPVSQVFEILGGDTFAFSPVLVPQTTVQGKEFGRVVIRTIPAGAAVYLDNILLEPKTPCTLESVSLGFHRFKFVKPGYESAEIERTVSAVKPLSLNVAMAAFAKPVTGASFLKVTVVPWANVYVDGKFMETTPIAGGLKVSSGQHEVKLENPNFKIWQKTYDFKPGQTVAIDVKLENIEGMLKLTVKPWADVYIDGKFIETTPIAEPVKLSAGRHILKLVNPNYKVYEETVDVPANKMLKKSVELVSK